MTRDISKKIAIIGSSKISEYHIAALKLAGIEISHCAASLNSSTITSFAKKNNIRNVWLDPLKLAAANNKWDGIVIATALDATVKLLEIAAHSKKPILVEKPVSLSSKILYNLKNRLPKSILVGFNRRFYKTVNTARDFVVKKK